VAYVPTSFPVLSETFVSLEVAELRRQGVRVEVVALFVGESEPGAPAPDHLWRQDVTRVRFGLAHLRLAIARPRRYVRFLRLYRQLRDPELSVRHLPWWALELERRGVQVVHAHFAWSSASRAWGLALLMGRPWSVTVHASDLFAVQEHLEEKLQAADAVVTVCEYNRRWLREVLGLTRSVEVVVCGVEVPERVALPEPTTDVLVVGRLVEKKGVDVLLEAVALLGDRPELRVTVVGDGPLREPLQAQALSLGVADRVTFAGARTHAATLDAIAHARVLCLPCRIASDGDRDSMPLVIKEAMAREVPVVASDLVAVPEMLDASCGWLVAPEDPGALAKALAAALDDPDEARARGAAGRRRVLTDLRLDLQVSHLREVFASLAGEDV
jgi:glycosyltransferase involved in cell wall biosynthesis